jgi:hypothetical protein
MPAQVDSNSPAWWKDGQFRIINSAGKPLISRTPDQFGRGAPREVALDRRDHFPMWIEAAWTDADGTIFAWYHHEPTGVCPGDQLTAPEIGALVSYDDGDTFVDLGPVLVSGDAVTCSAQNGFFAGGHGDFSVILDREQKYFYFLFGNYGGELESQGIGIARMEFEHRFNPGGTLRKYFNGGWDEPGLGGRLTPIFPARVAWQQADTDAFWGPAVHWNTHLQSFVVLMNRSCCRPKWPGEGIYITFNPDLSNPFSWTSPERIMEHPAGYYPELIGLGPGETDTLVGETGRLYIQGRSMWELVFRKVEPEAPPPPAESGPSSP